MENEILNYICGGGILACGILFVTSSYKIVKNIRETQREESEKFKREQQKKANELERILDSIPKEQRQRTIQAINVVSGDNRLYEFYSEPIISKYSTN
ncbi:MAG: hypothetical protein ABIH65_00305 [Nanoarchaeota archaeon]